MAEIPIERKPRRSMTPLLLILLVIVAVAAGWYWWTNKTAPAAAGATTSSRTPAVQIASVSAPMTYGLNFRRA